MRNWAICRRHWRKQMTRKRRSRRLLMRSRRNLMVSRKTKPLSALSSSMKWKNAHTSVFSTWKSTRAKMGKLASYAWKNNKLWLSVRSSSPSVKDRWPTIAKNRSKSRPCRRRSRKSRLESIIFRSYVVSSYRAKLRCNSMSATRSSKMSSRHSVAINLPVWKLASKI